MSESEEVMVFSQKTEAVNVEFDGSPDLRVFENKKKMIYEIVPVNASARAEIAHRARMNTLVADQKAVEDAVRMCPGNQPTTLCGNMLRVQRGTP